MVYTETSTSSITEETESTQKNEKNLEEYPNTRALAKNILWNAEMKEGNKTAIHIIKGKKAIALASKEKYADDYPILDKNIVEIKSEENLVTKLLDSFQLFKKNK